ncbi:hypothetical protein Desor_3664 [Desulfosporosinus orientis DSM 765]|uniref:Uncharacterized protein n=1 Tax=Desulfosporosinus orientis (strain ATCC 19365 / DSM 765 / NCIMB 8382 / VKM B-1628 / Singapore I) TaxID=768706 RepID=G7WIR8_DESOD|nr:hypothetical protein [Desulfosporosinus orientis]AET69142.1 hypothetical protein Desor_3664 [Desulfosporosinus orientis DSM 765]
MPKFLVYPIFTSIFSIILIANVPKSEIRRLSIYGIIFGGMLDVIVHLFGYITGLFSWTNFGPFGFIGVHIFPNVSWSIFFILYFYFLPQQRPLNYIFIGGGIFFSIMYYNMVIDMGILNASSRFWLPLFGFSVWFGLATWGYYKLNGGISLGKHS